MVIKKAIASLVLALALFTASAALAAGQTAKATVVQAGQTNSQTEAFYSQADQLRQEALQQNEYCLSCHGKEDITTQWKTDRGRTLQLYVSAVDYRKSVHSGKSCQSCHEGDGPDAFASAPHKFAKSTPKDCQSCHGNYFGDIYEQSTHSYHTKAIIEKGKPFPCSSCHNAHTFNIPARTEEIPASIAQSNERCLQCHSDLRGYEALTDKKLLDQNMAHWFLPKKEQHFKSVRCVDCHAGEQGTQPHTILPVKDIEVDCTYCHSKTTALNTKLNKYRHEQAAFSLLQKGLFDDAELLEKNAVVIASRKGQPDSVLGFMNAGLLDSKYITGITQTPWLNGKFLELMAAIVLLIGIHTALRATGTKAVSEHGPEVTMFPLLVRIWHWINVILFFTLLVTGFSMHFGGGVPFESAQSTHAIFALALIGLWVLYVFYLLLSGQIMQYLPRKDFIAASISQAKYYMYGIYKGQKNPAGHIPEKRLNPLQQMAYLGVLFILLPVLLVSGIALFFPQAIPLELMGMNGKRFLALLHTGAAFMAVAFIVVHLYLCTTGQSIFTLVRSMITGKMSGSCDE